jgi:glycosyltransferase involved in cell wall biosynthesis
MIEISVLMPINNLSNYTKTSIDSILNQSFKNLELIIIIDGNFNLINNFLNKYYDDYIKSSKINIINNSQNLGITKSLNIGISHCSGKYIARNDSDDISHPNRLQNQFNLILSNNNFKIIVSFFNIIDKSGMLIRLKKIRNLKKYNLFNYLNPIAHSSVLFEKKFIQDLNCYNENMHTSQDFELWSKAFLKNSDSIGVAKKALVDIRVHKNSISYNNSLKQKTNSVLICMRNRYPNKEHIFLNHNFIYVYDNRHNLFDTDTIIDLEALSFCYLGYNKFSLKGLSKLLIIIEIFRTFFFHKGLALKYIKSFYIN